MLPTTLVLEIRRLLDRGDLSQRAIAQQLGVSRGLVAEMADGRRGDHGRGAEQDQKRTSPYRELTIPTRCPTCGGMVYAPCRLCRARVVRAATLAAWRQLHEGQAPPRRAA
jgi:transcriptional regulator with XRE-family HTH domain